MRHTYSTCLRKGYELVDRLETVINLVEDHSIDCLFHKAERIPEDGTSKEGLHQKYMKRFIRE